MVRVILEAEQKKMKQESLANRSRMVLLMWILWSTDTQINKETNKQINK